MTSEDAIVVVLSVFLLVFLIATSELLDTLKAMLIVLKDLKERR